jgi:regulator of sigma E protease
MHISTNILALLFVLSFLIVFHEGGHFLLAKLFRFPVEVFSLGFGKRLFGFKRKETDYRVSMIPLGGYVKVVGLGPDESDVVSGSAEGSSSAGPRWQRLLILFAGPGVNLGLALVLLAVVFMIGREEPRYKREAPVVTVVDEGSPAEAAGIRAGDLIVTLSGRPVTTWEEVEMSLGLASRESTKVGVVRAGKSLAFEIVPTPRTKEQKNYDFGYTGLNPHIPAVVERVIPGYPGEKAGLKVGDRIVSVAGRPVVLYYQVIRQIREATADFGEKGPQPLEIVIERDGQRVTLSVVPKKDGDSWKVGFAPRYETVRTRLSPVAALAASWAENVQRTRFTGATVSRLVRLKGSMRQLSGPIDIAKFSGEAARTGLSPLLDLMAMLSLQLGLLNLLPIPLLDGGQILVTLLESAARRDFSLKVKERLLQAGFVFLVVLMATVLAFDVIKNVGL